MKKTRTKLLLMPFGIILSVFIMAACSTEQLDELEAADVELKKASATQNQLLADVKRATAKYHRVEVAIEDGYLEASHCVYNEELGAGMGYHFVKESLVDPFFDPLQPEALLYEKDENGKFNLIAVEYIVIDVDQEHPYFGTHPFDVGGTPVPVPHYSLHVWVWKNNPSGMYFPYNSKVRCH